ncbi:MAG: hypothetical protein LBJ92_03660 [Holosporales bacterium]|jgi:hypothetical protein|nr:hypothetical protein [Holosporales bacterium]
MKSFGMIKRILVVVGIASCSVQAGEDAMKEMVLKDWTERPGGFHLSGTDVDRFCFATVTDPVSGEFLKVAVTQFRLDQAPNFVYLQQNNEDPYGDGTQFGKKALEHQYLSRVNKNHKRHSVELFFWVADKDSPGSDPR